MANLIKESARGYDLVSSQDILFTKRKIFLTREVTDESCDDLLKNLMALNDDNPDEEITLYINSPGGDVLSGLAVFDYIKSMSAPLKTVCIGTAASMGAILFLSGKNREMYSHSRIMIHDPSYGNNNVSGKKPHEIQKELDKLIMTRDTLAQIIATTTGKTIKEINKITKEDSYYYADEALKFGLATKIIKDKENKDE